MIFMTRMNPLGWPERNNGDRDRDTLLDQFVACANKDGCTLRPSAFAVQLSDCRRRPGQAFNAPFELGIAPRAQHTHLESEHTGARLRIRDLFGRLRGSRINEYGKHLGGGHERAESGH
jgi:hypothetical protein